MLCTQAESSLERKRRTVGRGAGVLLASVALLLGASAPALADIVYLYDDLGRLVRVIRADGEAATYHYDGVGNILQITRESGVSQTTTIDTTSQQSGSQGSTVPLTITGGNLIGASVVCTSPGVSVRNVHSDLGQITLEMVIETFAPTGPVTCEIRGASVASLPFTITGPPTPVFLAGQSLSVSFAENSGVFVASTVAVAVEPVITSVAPSTGTPGTGSLVLTLTGQGFSGASQVTFLRNNASDGTISVTTFSVDGTGTSATVQISIAAGAPTGARVIRITTPAGSSTANGTSRNLFTVQ